MKTELLSNQAEPLLTDLIRPECFPNFLTTGFILMASGLVPITLSTIGTCLSVGLL